jgi:hypothetical protein
VFQVDVVVSAPPDTSKQATNYTVDGFAGCCVAAVTFCRCSPCLASSQVFQDDVVVSAPLNPQLQAVH